MTEVSAGVPVGSCEERFAGVRSVFAEQLATGEELGAAIAVDLDGETVLDLHGGWRDEARQVPWTADTLVNVWSCTKTVTSLAALLCVERGLLDVYAPVTEYWPEFGQAGKERVEVRHLMSHTSGVSGLDQPAVVEDLYDQATAAERFAAQAPWWEPGTASGYHALNQGHLVGEVLRRVTGRTLTEFVAEELAGPLGADVQIGCRESDRARVAPVVPPPPLPFDLAAMDPTSPAVRTLTGPLADAACANTAAWQSAEIGAANGHATAPGLLALLRTISLGGTVDGHRLLSGKTIDLVFDQQSDGVDLVLGVPLRFGIGFGLPVPASLPWIPEGRVCFWGGWGGSLILMDLDRRLTISYVMNRMGPGVIGSERSAAYTRAVYAALG